MLKNMEIMRKKQTCFPNSTASSTLGLHRNTQTISKAKPKIRIIHLFAPEIIKTDAENFRELVQKLTGKPTENCISTKKTSRIARRMSRSSNTSKGLHSSELRERIKGEEEIRRDADSGGGFFGGFQEFGGFMAELNEFPFLPLDASLMDACGEPQLA